MFIHSQFKGDLVYGPDNTERENRRIPRRKWHHKEHFPGSALEPRQAWESFPGPIEQFRSELGMKVGKLRNLLVEFKKLNHVFANGGGVELGQPEDEAAGEQPITKPGKMLELVFNSEHKAIRFPDVDTLVDFLGRAS